MKILLVSSLKESEVGGVISHMKTLGKGFEKLGHRVDYVTLSTIPRIFQVIVIYVPKLIIGKYSRQMSDVWHFAAIKLFMTIILPYKQLFNRYEAIISQDGYVCTSSKRVKSIFKIPVLLTAHSYVIDILSGDHFTKGSLAEKWFRHIDRASCEVADRIIAVDTRIRNYILDEYDIPPEKVDISINFVDIDEFKKIDVDSTLYDKFSIPSDKKIIFCPRRLVTKNGVIYAAESIKFMRDRMNDEFVVVFTGDKGQVASEMKKIIERDGTQKNAIFLGNVNHEQMRYLYNMSDVAIIPSINYKGLEEATSISALEAMACCVPVVASNIGGLKEIIVDGETGYLVSEKDPQKLADKICEVLSIDQEKLTNKAREFVKNNCSHTQKAQKYIQLINEIKT